MNDHTTTDGDDPLDEHVVAALRDVGPTTTPLVRRAHLDAALDEYDRLHVQDQPDSLAPVVPLRRRSTRVLQIAAAVAVVVAGVAVAVRLTGESVQQADMSSSGSATSSATAADAGADSSAESPVSTEAGPPGLDELSQGAARSSADDADKAAGGEAVPSNATGYATPRVPAGPVPGTLGTYASSAALQDTLQSLADAGTLPRGVDPAIACPSPPSAGPFVTASSAEVAGATRIVWVALGGTSGGEVAVTLVDPVTCRSI